MVEVRPVVVVASDKGAEAGAEAKRLLGGTVHARWLGSSLGAIGIQPTHQVTEERLAGALESKHQLSGARVRHPANVSRELLDGTGRETVKAVRSIVVSHSVSEGAFEAWLEAPSTAKGEIERAMINASATSLDPLLPRSPSLFEAPETVDPGQGIAGMGQVRTESKDDGRTELKVDLVVFGIERDDGKLGAPPLRGMSTAKAREESTVLFDAMLVSELRDLNYQVEASAQVAGAHFEVSGTPTMHGAGPAPERERNSRSPAQRDEAFGKVVTDTIDAVVDERKHLLGSQRSAELAQMARHYADAWQERSPEWLQAHVAARGKPFSLIHEKGALKTVALERAREQATNRAMAARSTWDGLIADAKREHGEDRVELLRKAKRERDLIYKARQAYRNTGPPMRKLQKDRVHVGGWWEAKADCAAQYTAGTALLAAHQERDQAKEPPEASVQGPDQSQEPLVEPAPKAQLAAAGAAGTGFEM